MHLQADSQACASPRAGYFRTGSVPPSLRAARLASVGSISFASAVRRQGQQAQGIVPVGKALPTPRQPQQGSPRAEVESRNEPKSVQPRTSQHSTDGVVEARVFSNTR